MVLSVGMLRGSGELTHREGVSPQLWPKDEASVNEVCTLLNLQARVYLTCFIYTLEVLYDTFYFAFVFFSLFLMTQHCMINYSQNSVRLQKAA